MQSYKSWNHKRSENRLNEKNQSYTVESFYQIVCIYKASHHFYLLDERLAKG